MSSFQTIPCSKRRILDLVTKIISSLCVAKKVLILLHFPDVQEWLFYLKLILYSVAAAKRTLFTKIVFAAATINH